MWSEAFSGGVTVPDEGKCQDFTFGVLASLGQRAFVQAIDGSGLIDNQVQRGIWGPYANHEDFHCRCLLIPRVQEALSKIYGKQYKTVFSHGDLGPHNILWKDGKIIMIDWERPGWFPEHWDYTRMYNVRGYFTCWWKMFEETSAKSRISHS